MTPRCAVVQMALLLSLVAAVRPAASQTFPTLTQPVHDFANVLDPASEAELDRRIRALHTASGDSVVVVTIDTYEPQGSIEDYAVRLFERAGIGDKQKDTGLLVLLAMKERAVRIEVGYGLEEFITDGFSGETIRNAMLPPFRQGQYGQGMLAGVTRVIARIAAKRGVNVDGLPAAPPQDSERESVPVLGLIGLIVFLFIVGRMSRHGPGGPGIGGRRRRTWSGWHGGVGGFGGGGFGGGFGGFGGGGGGGGFGGFGGGMSGGGGASGRF